MGFKVRLSHLVMPGKYDEMVEWFRVQDKKRSENDSDYRPPKRYINQFGETFRVECEFMYDTLSIDPLLCRVTNQQEFSTFIVPGSTTMDVWKEID